MKVVNLFLCQIFCVVSVWGQTADLFGIINESYTAAPVPKAEIFIQELNQLTETGQDGQFNISNIPYGKYTFILFAEGYTSQTEKIEINIPKQELTFTLDKLEIDIATVEVDAEQWQYAGMRRLRNVEGTAIYAAKKSEVIQLKNVMGNLAANNAREVYRAIAGLNIWENDGAGLQLAIGARGLDPNRTSNFNTRQNGYDISADALGYPESYYTPPAQALERIEIVRGAASLQYGTQFGGLLNFVFKKGPEDKPFELTSENTYGSNNFISTFNSIGGTKGKLNYYSFYQYKTGDGWRENSEFEQHTAYAGLNWAATDRLDISLQYTFMDYLAQQAGGLQDFEFEKNPRQSKRARNWFKVNWNLAALDLNFRLSDKTKINMRNFLLLAERDALGELGPINRPDPLRERDLIMGSYRNFGSELRLIHRYTFLNNYSTFLTGIRYYQGFTENRQGDASTGSDPDFTFLNPEDLEQSAYDFPSRNVSLFAENLFNISNRFSLTPGVRLEYIRTASDGFYKQRVYSGGQVIFEQKFEDAKLNERSLILLGLGMGFKVRPEVEVYANISQNYRAINFSDLAVVNPNLVVDSLLKDERGFNADLGIRGTLADERVRFDFSLFHLRYNDRIGISEIIVPDPIVIERAVAFRTNIGDARILGLETYWEADIWQLIFGKEQRISFSVFTNFSLLHGEYLSGQAAFIGNKVELIPPVSVKTGFNFRYENFKGSFQYTYVQEHFSDATNATFVANATRGLIPSYNVIDLSLSYEWKQFQLQAGINNLTNTAYFTRRATGYPGPGIIPADGRRFYTTLKVRI